MFVSVVWIEFEAAVAAVVSTGERFDNVCTTDADADAELCSWFNNDPFRPDTGVNVPKCLDCDTRDDSSELPVVFGGIAVREALAAACRSEA